MTELKLSPDAMTVLGLAGTALGFAESVDDEVERWLRPLRLYGEAGAALQALGVGEATLGGSPADPAKPPADPQETLGAITSAASRIAAEHGAASVGTTDILIAVMDHYGEAFDRALTRRSSDRQELLARLRAGDAG